MQLRNVVDVEVAIPARLPPATERPILERDVDVRQGDQLVRLVERQGSQERCVHRADDVMVRITIERLIQHLKRAGFVLMRSKPAAPLTTSNMPALG